ncbi:MAG: superoxide dismutase, Ni [Candidatus Marinimicrobia bacterium]|nr:superoxide dismutase, Ni [Candidatus Neomarinimicrobiota bacterium]
MTRNIMKKIYAHAHCDGPCGVYDPASARIAGEAVLSMTKKMLYLNCPDTNNSSQMASYLNTMSRYASVKEEQAQLCKEELLVLWTDYFKPNHLEDNPELHELFWNTAKLCSSCKTEVSVQHANELMENIKKIHDVFWKTKNRNVTWYTAG